MSPIISAGARTSKLDFIFRRLVPAFLTLATISSTSCSTVGQGFSDSPAASSRSATNHRFGAILINASLPPAVQGKWYNSALSVRGGFAPYNFSITQGSLPSGLSFNSRTGTISGVPVMSGSFEFTVVVTDDSNFGYGHKSLRLDVGSGRENQISMTVAPDKATLGPGGKMQFTAAVRNTSITAVTWSASSGSISGTGLFTAPTQSGTVVVTATSFNGKAQASATVSVVPPLTISTSSLTNAPVGIPYTATVTAKGGSQPYSWSLSSGSLPNGLTLNSTGLISGTASQPGTSTFSAKVTDLSSQTSTHQLTLVAHATSSTSSSTGGSASFDGPAELPRVYVQSTLADTPTPGNTTSVPAGSNLQTVLNSANCGDTIQLQAGATFSGDFKLPAKNCDDNHWIVIRSSAPDTALPQEGTRITPCFAGVDSLPGRPALNCTSTQKVMATLMAIKAGGPFTLVSGANHYRLGPGLEITRPAATGINFGLVIKDGNTPADHIVVDRDWVHGTAQDDTTRGVYLSGVVYAAVVDSYFNDFHCVAGIGTCVDSQTIAGGLGNLPQGTWKITNNFLEAAAENILFGGGVGTTVPTDIEIRHNHMFKPLTWMPGQPGFVGGVNIDPTKCVKFNTPGYCPFVVKNLFELKNAQRVLFEGNVLEHTWPGFTQHGVAIVLTALNQGGTTGNPNATVADITIRYNRISHAASGVVMGEANYGLGAPKLEARISIHDDIFDDLSPAYYNGDTSVVAGMAFQLSFCSTCTPLQDILINHVTMLLTSPRMFMVLGAPVGKPIQNLTFTNNIVSSISGLAITGTGASVPCAFYGATNLARLNSCIGPYSFVANALIGATSTWPTGNMYPYSASDVGFIDYNSGNGGDYNLVSGSSYTNISSDGTNLGADVTAVDQAIAGVQ